MVERIVPILCAIFVFAVVFLAIYSTTPSGQRFWRRLAGEDKPSSKGRRK